MTNALSVPAPHRHYEFATTLQGALSVQDVERAYLDSIDGLIPARAHALYRLDPETGGALAVASEVSTDFLDEYEEVGRADDPVLRFARHRRRPIDSSRLESRTVWEASGAYQCLDRAGYYHSMEAPVLVAGVPCATLNFARGAEDPPFGAADLRSAQRIGEQIGLALERALRYEDTRRRTSLMETALDHLPFAVVVTDLDANVLFCNRRATARVAGRDGVEDTPARDAIKETMSEFRRHNKRVSVVPVEGAMGEERVILKSIRLGSGSDASVSVFYTYAESRETRLPVWEVLSPREQEIAELVSHGLTTKQIAERAFVTENTVKQHLKRIFTKVDVRNRAELLQRIWTSADASPRSGDEA